MSRSITVATLGMVIAAATPSPAAAQAFLDQGTFTIARGGAVIGHEDFAIRTTVAHQGRQGVLAVATDSYADRAARAALELTPDSIPASYQVDVTAAGRVIERLSGQLGGGRFGVRLVTPQGEAFREFPVPSSFAILGNYGFDQYAFLPRPPSGTTSSVALLLPHEPRMVAGVVRPLGRDTVLVAGHWAPAERFSLTLPDGEARDFWVSPAGDLLQVAIPARAITATRVAPPRH